MTNLPSFLLFALKLSNYLCYLFESSASLSSIKNISKFNNIISVGLNMGYAKSAHSLGQTLLTVEKFKGWRNEVTVMLLRECHWVCAGNAQSLYNQITQQPGTRVFRNQPENRGGYLRTRQTLSSFSCDPDAFSSGSSYRDCGWVRSRSL